MEDTSVTAAAIIRFAEDLEDQSDKFYEELGSQFAPHKDRFLGFARESKKNKVLIVRTYQETITDALEACFSFEGLSLEGYAVAGLSAKGHSLAEALKMASTFEEQAIRFYSEVAVCCRSLLGTIPRAFLRVAEGRKKRLAELHTIR
jgi:hypothetical protein